MRYDNIDANILGPDGKIQTTHLGGILKIDQDFYDWTLKEGKSISGTSVCPCCNARLSTHYEDKRNKKTDFAQTALEITAAQPGFRHADAKAEENCQEVLKATYNETLRFFMQRLTGEKELSDELRKELSGIGRFLTKGEASSEHTNYWWVLPYRIIVSGVGTRERQNSKSKQNARYGYEWAGGSQEIFVMGEDGKEQMLNLPKKLRLCFVNNVRDKTKTLHDKKGKIMGTEYVPVKTYGQNIEFDVSEAFVKSLYATSVVHAASRHLPDRQQTLPASHP